MLKFRRGPRWGLVCCTIGFVASFCALRASALEIQPIWVTDLDMVMEGSPVVADLDGDGEDEIVTAAYQHVIVLDGDGEVLWRFESPGRFQTCPAVLVRDGEPPLIYVGDNRGRFTCLDRSGDVVWEAKTAPIFAASPAVADLDGDGAFEVIQGDKAGTVHVFDALTGDVVWTQTVEGECASPVVADLDNDGKAEIVIATGAGKVFWLEESGELRGTALVGDPTPDWATSSPIAFVNSKGQACVVAAASPGRIWCYGGGHPFNVLWDRPTRGAVASALSVGDIDGDGRADIFAVTQLGQLHRFDEDGRMLWDIDTQGRSLASGAVLDIDGEGLPEFVLCTQDGNLLVFNEAGDIVFNHQFPHRTINMTIAPGDIVKERPGLEFAVTGGESGLLYCFGTTAPVNAAASWRTYRGDLRLTAAWFGLADPDRVRMRPDALAWDTIRTGEPVTFIIDNPRPQDAPLVAYAACVGPDGTKHAAIGKVVGRRGVLQLPLHAAAPGTYRFTWTLTDAAGSQAVAGSREVTVLPYGNDRALAARAVRDLRAAAGESPAGYKAALASEADAIEAEAALLAELQTAAPGAPGSFGEDVQARTASLNARAARALEMARMGMGLMGDDAKRDHLFVFEGTQWENRDIDRQVPDTTGNPLLIRRRAVTGEHEPVSVKLFNASSEPAAVRVSHVQSTPLDGANAPAVTLYRGVSVPTNQGTVAWDPFEPLEEGDTLEIPPLESREVWIDLDLTNVSGRPIVRVDFDSGTAQGGVQIELDVLPFHMAPPSALRLCSWATYNEHAVKDLLDHGNTVFVAPLPQATFPEDGGKVVLDYARLDRFLAPLAGHDVYLLMNGIPNVGLPREDPNYVPRLAEYFEALISHLEAKGVSEERVAMYPHDEPGVHGWETVNDYIDFARRALQARPELEFYVNGPADLAMYEALNEVAAIWCPGFHMLADDSPEMRFLRSTGKTLWSYDCFYRYARPIGANTKTINVVAQYRLPAIQAWHFGAEGIGYWCYNVGPSMWDPIELEYPLVYQNPDGTVTTSRRWEAVRESLEDARILIALREKLSDPDLGDAARERIGGLFDTVAELSRQSLSQAALGVARYMLDDAHNGETVMRLREEMLDCVEALDE